MLGLKDLHGYQFTSSDHIINNNFAGLLLEMGLGKTVSTLTAINILMYEELEVDKVLVVAPKRVAENVWSSEVKEWEHLKHLKVSRIIGTEKQRTAALKEKADIYTLGRDNVAWLCAKYGGGMLPFDMLVLDESSSFKNHDSVRFKALKKVRGSFSRAVILTGTFAPNGLHDIWAQVFMLDGGERLGRTITEFRSRYFHAVGMRGYTDYKLRGQYENAIYKKIEDVCISMKSKDYITLPPRIDNYISVKFPKHLRERYEEFKEESVLELIDSENEKRDALGLGNLTHVNDITAASAAALAGKLLQFCNGAIYNNEEDKDWHEIHKLKLDALADIMAESNGQNVIVAYAFKHDLARIMKKLKKYKPVKLSTEKDIEDFKKGKIRVLAMHPASGGHGLNLQSGGNVVIWFGLTYSLEYYAQLNARVHRQGQKLKSFIHHIVVEDSVDTRVIDALANKHKTQDSLMDAVKATVQEYL